jgi:hypothetical protein
MKELIKNGVEQLVQNGIQQLTEKGVEQLTGGGVEQLIGGGIGQLAGGAAGPLMTINLGCAAVIAASTAVTVDTIEKTKRAQIAADRETKIAAIRAQRDFFMDYLQKTFDERADNFCKIFEVIDSALLNDNIQQLALGLDSLNKLAAESPFKVLADINILGTALENKTEFEF